MPTHYRVRIDFGYYFGDNWNNDMFYVYTDDHAQIYNKTHSSSSYNASFCGGSAGDFYVQDTAIKSSHSNSYIAIYFSTNLTSDASTAWFAINKIRINMCHATCYNCTGPNHNQCNECYGLSYLQTDGTCVTSCKNDQFITISPNICHGKLVISKQFLYTNNRERRSI